MRTLFRSSIAALAAVFSFGCVDDSDPMSAAGSDLRPSHYEGGIENPLTTVTAGDIALLDLQVRGPEFESTLRYQIPLVDGQSAHGLSLPIGSGYEIDVRGYDVYGEQTYQGEVVLEYVELGENRSLAVTLDPIGEGKRADAVFALAGEERAPEGLTLVIEADRREIGEGQSAILRAYGVDAKGEKIELDPLRLNWSVDDPRHGRFDLDHTRPGDPIDWIKFNAHRFLEEDREAHVELTYGDITVLAGIVIYQNGYVEISAGAVNTCALRHFGDLYCWGLNEFGQLGIGSATAPDHCHYHSFLDDFCSVRPMAVTGGRLFSAVSVGTDHVCAIEKTMRAAFCWGYNHGGQVGAGPNAGPAINAPYAVKPPSGSTTPLAFKSISAGTRVSCGVTMANEEYCWGAVYGDFHFVPKRGPGTAAATAVITGSLFSCRLDSAGTWCEGFSSAGPGSQPGNWKLLGDARTAKHVCAIDSGDKTWCWGDISNGKLGNGPAVNNRIEVLTTTSLNMVETGEEHSCGLSGVVAYCWGSNSNGQLGLNDLTTTTFAPRRVTSHPTTPHWAKISAGRTHTCALDVQNNAWCWGENYSGQIGSGTKIDFNSRFPRQGFFGPVKVVGQ